MLSPDHLQPLLGAVDPKGHKLVDYTQHLNRHADPAIAKEYSEGVLNAPNDVQPQAVTAHHAVVTTLNGHQFSLSPYFERISPHVSHLVHYPLSGWSKMATQSIYHAGKLGRLVPHQHVIEHMTSNGEFEPMVATHISHDYVPLREALHEGHPQVMADAAKIGLIDFLINNQDRHEDSLLAQRAEDGEPTIGLQALGHDRAFQYKRPNRWQHLSAKHDHPLHYVLDSPAMAYLAHEDARVHGPGPIDDALHWWSMNGHAIRRAFEGNLKAIQSRAVSNHIGSNFRARADALDALLNGWPAVGDMTEFSPYRARENSLLRQRAGLSQVPVYIHTPEAL